MANIIPLSHFVNVTSAGVSPSFSFNRLNALVISTPATPQAKMTEYLSLQAVGNAYGLASPEYEFAKTFFGYVSKTATTPERLSFYAYSSTATTASLKGAKVTNLDNIKQQGGFAIEIDGQATQVTVNLEAVASLTQAAEAISTALGDTANCSYSSITGGFIVTTATAGAEHTISLATAPESGTDLSSVLGLSATAGAVVIDGQNGMTIAEALNDIALINGNYVSISALVNLDTEADFTAISEWTAAQQGRYCFIVSDDNTALTASNTPIFSNLFGNDGFILNYGTGYGLNALTQAIIASVDFSAVGGAINVNFINADSFENVAVTTAEALENLNAQRANTAYTIGGYGQSQTLYGEGNIFGQIFSDISGFIGNTWLKAQLEIYGTNALISLPLISLRGAGQSVIMAALQEPINIAKRGGIIVPVGTGNLTTAERTTIITATGDSDVPDIIEQNGYFVMVQPLTDDDIANKRVRILVIYTRNIPVNRVVIQNYVLGA